MTTTMTTPTTTSGHSMDHMHMGSGMAMYFHAGTKEYVLLKQLRVDSIGGMALACCFVIILGICFEGLKMIRVFLFKCSAEYGREVTEKTKLVSRPPSESDPVLPKEAENKEKMLSCRMFNGIHLLQCFLHVLQLFLGYCSMLIFMTYNVWLCLSVLIGAALGYALFGCHRQQKEE
ncbi:protein SLC31A2-like [Lineus longissimus]|uniref:protein SLC31A2-like n=1 Tax=Lineus longissimus TaxID=88925 RepID=UPI002B4CCE87